MARKPRRHSLRAQLKAAKQTASRTQADLESVQTMLESAVKNGLTSAMDVDLLKSRLRVLEAILDEASENRVALAYCFWTNVVAAFVAGAILWYPIQHLDLSQAVPAPTVRDLVLGAAVTLTLTVTKPFLDLAEPHPGRIGIYLILAIGAIGGLKASVLPAEAVGPALAIFIGAIVGDAAYFLVRYIRRAHAATTGEQLVTV